MSNINPLQGHYFKDKNERGLVHIKCSLAKVAIIHIWMELDVL